MSGINPKTGRTGKTYNEHTRRYVFYPYQNLILTESQHTSPVWSPRIARGRVILLESVDHKALVPNGDPYSSEAMSLGHAVMGTDAQVNFLVNSWGQRGMRHLMPMDDMTPEQAVQIEMLLYPDMGENLEVEVPKTLIKLGEHFASLKFDKEDPLESVASDVRDIILTGIVRATAWAREKCNELSREVTNAKLGKPGRGELNARDKYIFEMVERPAPEDLEGVNMGNQMGEVLKKAFEQAGLFSTAPGKESSPERKDELQETIEAQMDAQRLEAELQEAKKKNEELEKALKELA